MDYRRLETLVIVTGTTLVVGGLLLVPADRSLVWADLIARAFIVIVLAAAAHWGRDGGTVAAALAVIAYVVFRIPTMAAQGLSPALVNPFSAYVLIYGALGVLGGEVFGRLRYLITRLGESVLLDEETGVFNRAYSAQTLSTAISAHQRYQTQFSLIVITLSPGLLSELRPVAQRKLLRNVATAVRNTVRVLDDVSHLGQGRFLLLLRETSRPGAQVAADRTQAHVRDLLGARDEAITARVLATPEDFDAIGALAESLTPADTGRSAVS